MAKPPKDMQRCYRLCFTIAAKLHKDQVYGDGKPYFQTHVKPLHDHFVKLGMWREACLSLVHDLVEDQSEKITYVHLAAMGMPVWLMKSLRCITKLEDESYDAYLLRVISDDISWRVKIRDVLLNAFSPGCGRRRLLKYSVALQNLVRTAPDHIIT